MDTAQKNKLKLITLAIGLANFSSFAGDWQFTPKLFLNEIYSDNVLLDQETKQDGFVHQTGVELVSSFSSPLLDFTLNSKNTFNSYSMDSELNADFVEYQADISLALWQAGPRLTASSSIRNVARNAARNGIADLIARDTVEVRSNAVGLAYQYGNSQYSLATNITLSDVESGDGIGERDATAVAFSGQSGPNSRALIWQLDAQLVDSENGNFNGKRHQAEALIGYYTGMNVFPFVRAFDEDAEGNIVGLTQPTFSSIGPGIRWQASRQFNIDISYNFVEDETLHQNYPAVSLNWQPSQRTSISAAYSKRFFGDSYQIDLQHRNRRLTNTLTYNETLQAFDREYYEQISLGTFLCPQGEITSISQCNLAGVDPIDLTDGQLLTFFDFNLIENHEFSLRKSGSWTSTLTLNRTTFSLSVTQSDIERLDSGATRNNKNASVRMNRRLSPRSDFNLSATLQVVEIGSNFFEVNNQLDHYRTYEAKYSRRFARSLTAEFGLRHYNRSSTNVLRNIEESRVTINLKKEF